MRISDWSSDVCSSDLGQDFYNFTVGLALLAAVHLGLRYLWRECLAQADVMAAIRTGVKWVWVLSTVLLLAVLWLTVIPLMLGVIFELLLVIRSAERRVGIECCSSCLSRLSLYH